MNMCDYSKVIVDCLAYLVPRANKVSNYKTVYYSIILFMFIVIRS